MPKWKNHGVFAVSKAVEFAFNRTYMPRLRKNSVLLFCSVRVFLQAICHKFFACFFNANNRVLLLFRQKKLVRLMQIQQMQKRFSNNFFLQNVKEVVRSCLRKGKTCRFLLANSAKSNSVFKQNLLTKRGKHGSTNK